MKRRSDTKLLLMLLTSTVFSLGVIACGSSSKGSGSPPEGKSGSVASTTGEHGNQASGTATYGHEASPADKRAITALVKRYYAAAAADNGAQACTLIYSIFEEAIPEDYGQPPGPPGLSGKTCTVVLSKLFRQVPGQPAAVLASTQVTGVRVNGRKGLVLLHSRTMPEGEITVERELGSWKVASLIGSPSPGSSSTSQSSPTTTATSSTPTTAVAPAPTGHLKDSKDSDSDPESYDDEPILDYGHAASAMDRRIITALVTRYYAAAAADDGAEACSIIYSVVAEAVPESYESAPGLHGSTCAGVMTKVFGQHHRQMVADSAVLKVMRVRVEGDKGLATVYLGKTPEPYVLVHRDHGTWKMESLSEVGLP
ncbi:MAG TPA: hypothetical protein VIJ39_01050 [Solirubrobacteraceae bacterium]